jgi:hypothetical protein
MPRFARIFAGAGVRSLNMVSGMVSGRPPISIVPPEQRMAEWPPEEPHKEIAETGVFLFAAR